MFTEKNNICQCFFLSSDNAVYSFKINLANIIELIVFSNIIDGEKEIVDIGLIKVLKRSHFQVARLQTVNWNSICFHHNDLSLL